MDNVTRGGNKSRSPNKSNKNSPTKHSRKSNKKIKLSDVVFNAPMQDYINTLINDVQKSKNIKSKSGSQSNIDIRMKTRVSSAWKNKAQNLSTAKTKEKVCLS